jgi:hypothetical protein
MVPLGAAMIMVGVISIMCAALPVDPNRMSAAAMAFGALAVGGLVTIGSVMVEVLRKLIEGGDHTDLKPFGDIITSHALILVYPFISAIVLIGGSFAGTSSTQLFKILFWAGGGVAFISGAMSRYALDQQRGPAILRGCLWFGVSMILILAKAFA